MKTLKNNILIDTDLDNQNGNVVTTSETMEGAPEFSLSATELAVIEAMRNTLNEVQEEKETSTPPSPCVDTTYGACFLSAADPTSGPAIGFANIEKIVAAEREKEYFKPGSPASNVMLSPYTSSNIKVLSRRKGSATFLPVDSAFEVDKEGDVLSIKAYCTPTVDAKEQAIVQLTSAVEIKIECYPYSEEEDINSDTYPPTLVFIHEIENVDVDYSASEARNKSPFLEVTFSFSIVKTTTRAINLTI